MGLTVLHPTIAGTGSDANALVVDIVAVHGLNGGPTKTWTDPKTKALWLQDFLPRDVEGARVLNFSYNADAAFGNTTADILDHAKDLLGSMIDKRGDQNEQGRPTIFIAHSLGGIIVKQALVWAHIDSQYQSIKDHTIGIIFLGTPHQGSRKASYGKVLADVATTFMRQPTPKLIDTLRSNSDTLMRLTSEFKCQAPNFKIVSFFETKPMSFFSSLVRCSTAGNRVGLRDFILDCREALCPPGNRGRRPATSECKPSGNMQVRHSRGRDVPKARNPAKTHAQW